MKSYGVVFLVLAALSVLSSVVEHRALWGYWWSRPSFASAVEGATAVKAFSILRFENRLVFAQLDRLQALNRLKNQEGSKGASLVEAQLLERLGLGHGSLDQLPEVSQTTLEGSWRELLSKGWLPKVRDPRYRDSGIPVSGLAARFLKGNSEYLLLAYKTSEIANDRYAYSEALFDNLDSAPSLLKQEHFFYEIAGLEGIGYAVLLPINAALFLVCYVALRFVTFVARRGKSHPRQA